jgi:cytochrome c oxidase cbb3-type subunit 4
MYAHFYAGMRWTSLPLLALGLFLAVFLAAIVRVWLPSRRQEIEAASRLPFDDRERRIEPPRSAQ